MESDPGRRRPPGSRSARKVIVWRLEERGVAPVDVGRRDRAALRNPEPRAWDRTRMMFAGSKLSRQARMKES